MNQRSKIPKIWEWNTKSVTWLEFNFQFTSITVLYRGDMGKLGSNDMSLILLCV
jgi:hypothetical protein